MKPRARLITMAWGDPYVEILRSLTLPALLAPGNLPSLTSMLDCELIVLTEQRFDDELRGSPLFRRLESFCPVRLVSIDDLVTIPGRYGIALSFALHRGFADLGDAMTDRHLIFFNADFVLADGSLRTVGQRILAGERLIHAPSYCAIQEQVEPMLRRRVDPATQALVVPPREMAEMILAHRHYTIRGKTVNQRVFHGEYIEQFYWQVDEHTLLGRQMPIALVCVKPERVVREMRTFWDYGVVSELCPDATPCVLGDSDAFCMLELRHEATMLEQMSLGWPSPEHIAKVLGRFVTEDQKTLGRFPLVLHSRDMPAGIEAGERELADVVDRVYRAMPARAVPHLNHPFWVHHYEPFLAEQAQYFAKRRGTPSADGSAPMAQRRSPAERDDAPRADGPGTLTAAPPTRRAGRSVRRLLGAARARWVGAIPFVRPLHPLYAVLQPTYELLERQLERPRRRILLVSDCGGALAQLVRTLTGRGHSVVEAPALPGRDGPDLVAALGGVLGRGPFDLVVCDLAFDGLLKVSALLRAVQPAMTPGGRVIVFHLNWERTSEHLRSRTVITQATAPVGRSEVFFVTSPATLRANALIKRGQAARMRWRGALGTIALGGFTGAALALSGSVSVRRPRVTRDAVPSPCTSLTMFYELLPGDPAPPGAATDAVRDERALSPATAMPERAP